MIRVGFALAFTDQSWLGGVNYFRNLFHAVWSLPNRRIEPVLLTGRKADTKLYRDFPPVECHQTALLDWRSSLWWWRKIWQHTLGRDVLLERFLRRHGIKLLSHSAPMGRRARIPSLGWIPDFQHRHLPEFFTPSECAQREWYMMRLCREATRMVVSSQAAQSDLANFLPEAAARSHVLRFVADPGLVETLPRREDLEARYGFHGDYFHLPNQFWAHKNHRVVIQALSVLKRQKRPVLVLATGNNRDQRNPGFFDDLMTQTKREGIQDCFKILGVVPYQDLMALMVHSLAVINPSLFEGWSTTIEEAKSVGKRIIVSDLPVHREQAPSGGIFFDPHSAESLAIEMFRVWEARNPAADHQLRVEAKEQLACRMTKFALEYEAAVLATIECHEKQVKGLTH